VGNGRASRRAVGPFMGFIVPEVCPRLLDGVLRQQRHTQSGGQRDSQGGLPRTWRSVDDDRVPHPDILPDQPLRATHTVRSRMQGFPERGLPDPGRADMPGHSWLRVRRSWLLPVLMTTLLLVAMTGGAAAAIETDTVHSYWRGVWWSISLITTVGFIGEPPRTGAGAVLSVASMVGGFLLLAMVSASLAALFVRDEELPRDAREEKVEELMLASLHRLEARLASVETQLSERPTHSSVRAASTPGACGSHPDEIADHQAGFRDDG